MADPTDVSAGGTLVPTLLQRVPEFAPYYWALLDEGDDDPGEPAVLMELADFVASRLVAVSFGQPTLEAALEVVEGLLDDLADDAVGGELVGAAFFDSFSPEDQHRLVPWLGPRARALLDELDAPPR
jgi:hypothetical protein